MIYLETKRPQVSPRTGVQSVRGVVLRWRSPSSHSKCGLSQTPVVDEWGCAPSLWHPSSYAICSPPPASLQHHPPLIYSPLLWALPWLFVSSCVHRHYHKTYIPTMWMGSVSDFNTHAIVSSQNLYFCICLLNNKVFWGHLSPPTVTRNSLRLLTLFQKTDYEVLMENKGWGINKWMSKLHKAGWTHEAEQKNEGQQRLLALFQTRVKGRGRFLLFRCWAIPLSIPPSVSVTTKSPMARRKTPRCKMGKSRWAGERT